MSNELKSKMKAKLEKSGLGSESILVFGSLRLNIHVTTMSVETANKWCTLLTKVTGKGATVTQHTWNAKEQKGTCLLPTLRHGYLIAVVGA